MDDGLSHSNSTQSASLLNLNLNLRLTLTLTSTFDIQYNVLFYSSLHFSLFTFHFSLFNFFNIFNSPITVCLLATWYNTTIYKSINQSIVPTRHATSRPDFLFIKKRASWVCGSFEKKFQTFPKVFLSQKFGLLPPSLPSLHTTSRGYQKKEKNSKPPNLPNM